MSPAAAAALAVALPLAGALLAQALPRRAPLWLAGTALGTLAAALVLVEAVAAGGPLRVPVGGWPAPLGIAWRIDITAGLFLLVTAVLTTAAAAAARLLAVTGLLPPLLYAWAALNALFLAGDAFHLYVALELLTLAAVWLVSLGGTREALAAALRYLLTAVAGSLLYLLGAGLLYAGYGTLDLALLAQRADRAAAPALALMSAGLMVKAALFPLHLWLPPAHASAPAPASALLSALVVKGGIYILWRLWLEALPAAATPAAATLLAALGAGGVVWGSLLALRQSRLKLLVAYSTVAQLGYLPLLLPLAQGPRRAEAFAGAVWLALCHAFAKAAMFLGAGVVLRTYGHDRLGELGDLAHRLPITLFALALAGTTLMGLPPSGGFAAKWLLLGAALAEGRWGWALLLVGGGLLAAAYSFRVVAAGFGARPPSPPPAPPAARRPPPGVAGAGARPGADPARADRLPAAAVAAGGGPVKGALPIAIVLSALGPGLLIFLLREEQHRLRVALNMTGALLKVALVAVALHGVYQGESFEARLPLVPGYPLLLRIDPLALLFVSLSALLWLLTTLYAIGYLEGSPNRSRFFGFFSICVSATTGIALAGNLFTLFLFYELLTLSTWPLVIHRETPESLRAGRVYLAYTLGGSAVLLCGIVWLHTLAGPFDFAVQGGALDHLGRSRDATLIAIFALLAAGFGVKAALVPLHAWLPLAMVAPAPVSALLHAVAVVKAGAFGIVRTVYDVYGSRLAHELGATTVLAWVAGFTIVYGSIQALRQEELKRRLAYSTVSQVSYIVLGVCLFGPLATIGGLVHLVHQGIMKITLFFAAGNLAETLGIHRVDELDGTGRRLPFTLLAFSVAALGMMSAPPLAGFVSEWYLGSGALAAGQSWALLVLIASSLLNAAYFLPLLHRIWFRPPRGPWRERIPAGRLETRAALLLPPLATGALTLLLGLFAGTLTSALGWVQVIAAQEYPP